MAELKTKRTEASVTTFLDAVPDENRCKDCYTVLEMMQEIVGEPASMWGDSIVGLGSYHYKYASGQEADWPLVGFSPRKQNLTLYIMSGFDGYDQLMQSLGKHSTGKACLYVKRLADINLDVLRQIITLSVEHMRRTHSLSV